MNQSKNLKANVEERVQEIKEIGILIKIAYNNNYEIIFREKTE